MPRGRPKKSVTEKKLTPSQMRAELERIKDGCRCAKCGLVKDRETKFYIDTDPVLGGESFSRLCRDCAKAIACNRDLKGEDHEPTKESVIEALMYINKPYLDTVWNASVQESENLITGKVKTNVWASYIKNIQMVQYIGMTYKDSDHLKMLPKGRAQKSNRNVSVGKMLREHEGMDTYDSYEKNKEDVIRLLDYDPFEKEVVSDQPFLYAQLLMLLDSNQDQEMDMIRLSSAITITRSFLQSSKIDDALVKLMPSPTAIEDNAASIKALQDAKQKCITMITNLAAESCLSLANSKRSIRGENTWTGRIKKIKDLNLRDSEVNGFDIATCRGMQQVQEISDASIMKQLALDDSDWSDMVAEMRVTIQDLRRERDQYKEINRILLKENLELKDTLTEQGFDVKNNTQSLKDIYSIFAGYDEEEANDEESDTVDSE